MLKSSHHSDRLSGFSNRSPSEARYQNQSAFRQNYCKQLIQVCSTRSDFRLYTEANTP